METTGTCLDNAFACAIFVGGYIIAEHLLSLGHKHITYICTPIRPKEIGRIHRLAGLRSCFKDHGLDPEWVEVKSPTIAAYGRYSADNSEYQNGYDMASQALDEHTSSTDRVIMRNTESMIRDRSHDTKSRHIIIPHKSSGRSMFI